MEVVKALLSTMTSLGTLAMGTYLIATDHSIAGAWLIAGGLIRVCHWRF